MNSDVVCSLFSLCPRKMYTSATFRASLESTHTKALVNNIVSLKILKIEGEEVYCVYI